MESDAIDQPEQALTEALLALSWPLPRTVEDADAALTRLEQVKAVLTRLEQESVGSDAWWAGQVDALATQSGFVLEWWRPVLRDPDLDWTLNHQAHLTADLATLASAGARLLDQIEPHVAEGEAEAAHARKKAQDARWGPTAVPPYETKASGAGPAPRPQPPEAVFGGPVLSIEIEDVAGAAAAAGLPISTAPAPSAIQAMGSASQKAEARQNGGDDTVPSIPEVHEPEPASSASPGALDAPEFPPPPPAPPGLADPGIASQGENPDVLEASAAPSVARHRRPAYDFDDPQVSSPPPVQPSVAFSRSDPDLAPAVLPQPGIPPRTPVRSGPARAGHPVPGFSAPAHAYADPYGDDDEPSRVVPTGLRRHQRRLLVQTGVILAAIGGLCWWAVYSLGDSNHPTAAGDVTHSTPADSPAATHAAGAGVTHSPSTAASAKPSTQASQSPSAAPPSTSAASGPDQTTATTVHVTLLGGSSSVPQIDVLITVDTAGSGQITVTGSYYGATSHGKLAAASTRWVLSGHTSYQFSEPIANSEYCGSTFTYTLDAGARSSTQTTSPGC